MTGVKRTGARSERQRGRRPVAASWAVGVDAGGTWVRLRARQAGGRVLALTLSAAPARDLPRLISGAWRRWRLRPATVSALVVATRGVWTASERRAATAGLSPLARRVRVISDVEAAHRGAFGGGPGVLVLAGTGSIALGHDGHGRWERAGGLGPLLGDEGSAFWIGRQWLAALARRGDAAKVRRLARAPDAVARVAAAAPRVLGLARRGNREARSISAAAQEELARLGIEVARELRLTSPVPVSWAGSLMGQAQFRAGVWRALRRRGPAIAPRPPREDAVTAALELAVHLGEARRPGELTRRL